MDKRKMLLLIAFISGIAIAFACGMGLDKTQLKSLKEKNEALQRSSDTWKDMYTGMRGMYDEERKSNSQANLEGAMQAAYVSAWCDVAYKDNYKCLNLKDDYSVYQLIVSSNYQASDANKIIEEVANNIFILNEFIDTEFQGETIYLKYLDRSDSALMEFQFF